MAEQKQTLLDASAVEGITKELNDAQKAQWAANAAAERHQQARSASILESQKQGKIIADLTAKLAAYHGKQTE